MIQCVNRLIACEPFPSLAVEKEFKGNVAFVKNKQMHFQTKVVYTGFGLIGEDIIVYRPGWKVYIDAEVAKGHPWAKKVYKLGDEPKAGEEDKRVSFILIPEQFIQMVEPIEEDEAKALPEGTIVDADDEEDDDDDDGGFGGMPSA